MKIIMLIVLLSLCLNVFPEGQIEEEEYGIGIFEIVYTEYLFNKSVIFILRCKITKDLFLVMQYRSYRETGIAMIKLDPEYNELIKEKENE